MISLIALLVTGALLLCYVYSWVIVFCHEMGHWLTCLLFRRKAIRLRVAFPPGVSLSLRDFDVGIGPNIFAGGGVMAEEPGSGPEALADLVLAWVLPAVATGGLTKAWAGWLGLRTWEPWLTLGAFIIVLAGGAYYEARATNKAKSSIAE